MKPKLVIWGASGHARVVADIVRTRGSHDVAGFLDDLNPGRKEAVFCGAKVLGGRETLPALLRDGVREMIVAVGDCAARLRLAEAGRAAGFKLATAVHPAATVAAEVTIGEGSVVMAGAVVNAGARVGENVIINSGAIVEHECVIEDGAHISPGVSLAGAVRIGRGSWIGVGATVIQKISIGPGSVVGAAALVVHDIPAGVLAYGVPAKVIREVGEEESRVGAAAPPRPAEASPA